MLLDPRFAEEPALKLNVSAQKLGRVYAIFFSLASLFAGVALLGLLGAGFFTGATRVDINVLRRSRQASPLRLENALQAGEVACCVMLEESSDERREDREAGRGRRADPEGHACTGRSVWLDEVLAGAT